MRGHRLQSFRNKNAVAKPHVAYSQHVYGAPKTPQKKHELIVPKQKLKVILLCVGVGLIIVLAVMLRVQKSTQQSQTKKQPDYSSIIREAVPYLNQDGQTKLQVVADKVKAMPDYDKSVDLLYILSINSAYAGDIDNATHYVDMLQKLFDPNVRYSPEFGTNVMSPEDIRALIASKKSFNDEIKANAILSQPEQAQ